MINFKSDFSYYSYSLPEEIIKERYYIDIYYKNMCIKWVLEDFSLKEIDTLSNIITKATKHVQYNKISKSFICNNKWGLNKIEQINMNGNRQNAALMLSSHFVQEADKQASFNT